MGDVLDLLYNFINDKPAPSVKHLARMAISRIEHLQQQVKELEAQVPKWISVDDQLPETYESYGFNGVDVEVSDIVATNQGAAVYLDGYWCEVGWDSHDLGKRIQGVTHWMPLPQKSKG